MDAKDGDHLQGCAVIDTITANLHFDVISYVASRYNANIVLSDAYHYGISVRYFGSAYVLFHYV